MPKNNSSSEPVTRKVLREELRSYVTKTHFDIRLGTEFDSFERKIEDKLVKFRDQILNSIDKVMGQLELMREENIIGTHQTRKLREQVDNHERRLARLEHP